MMVNFEMFKRVVEKLGRYVRILFSPTWAPEAAKNENHITNLAGDENLSKAPPKFPYPIKT